MSLLLLAVFGGRTRIGFSVSDREIARAFHARPLTAAEREQRAREEAAIDARAKAFADRWAPIVSEAILIAAVVIVVWWAVW